MKKRNLVLLSILIGFLMLDQISKYYISTNLDLYEQIPVIDNFFSITYAQNTGAAWSLLEGKMWFFYVVTCIVLVIMVFYFRTLKEYQFLSKIGVALIVSGALGNFIDRLRLGYVVDFLDFIIFGYDFPVFNIADTCLCIGIAFVILDEFMNEYGVSLWKNKNIQ